MAREAQGSQAKLKAEIATARLQLKALGVEAGASAEVSPPAARQTPGTERQNPTIARTIAPSSAPHTESKPRLGYVIRAGRC